MSKENAEDKSAMLREALKCVNGSIDFDRLAVRMGVANAEAMRKRFKRVFEKDEEPLVIVGSKLGKLTVDGDSTEPKTPRTPKAPRTPKTAKGIKSEPSSPTKISVKAEDVEVKEEEEDDDKPKANSQKKRKSAATADVGDNEIAETKTGDMLPKKKARATPKKTKAVADGNIAAGETESPGKKGTSGPKKKGPKKKVKKEPEEAHVGGETVIEQGEAEIEDSVVGIKVDEANNNMVTNT